MKSAAGTRTEMYSELEKYCPNYEIKRWDESNFDINYNDYVREAYEAKKWAFVTDIVRLYALVTYGGIYMDTDVEVLKSLNRLLAYKFRSYKSCFPFQI